MAKPDPRVDAYLAEVPAFAQPILKHLRRLIRQACPAAKETIKWGKPFYDYHGILCGFVAFKAHCALFFWRDIDLDHLLPKTNAAGGGMGQFGRITSLADLPSDAVLLACLRSAVEQRDAPDSKVKRRRPPAKPAPVPPDLQRALATNAKAAATFRAFAPSHRNEYVRWITEAKRPETRANRLTTALQWLAAGKPRNWIYLEQRNRSRR